jgi:hypothetical protein
VKLLVTLAAVSVLARASAQAGEVRAAPPSGAPRTANEGGAHMQITRSGTQASTPIALALALALQDRSAGTQTLRGAPAVSPAATTQRDEVREMKICLKVGQATVTATLLDSAAARDFVKLLPITLTVKDLFGREKYGHLPRAISEDGRRARTYEVGQIAYWPPGPDVAVYYRQDGESIPAPGIVVLGEIDSGVERIAFPGSRTVIVEPCGEAARASER